MHLLTTHVHVHLSSRYNYEVLLFVCVDGMQYVVCRMWYAITGG